RVAVIGAEIGARRENADQQEIGSIGPERIVVVVRPEREGEDVTIDEWPEDRAGPAAPAVPPPVPAPSPEVAAPVIPFIRVAERVAVEAGAVEIVQAVEVLRDELIVRELIMGELGARGLIAAELVMGKLAPCVHPVRGI